MLDLEENIEEIHQKRETEGNNPALLEKVRNMMFPMSWEEAFVNPKMLLMVNAFRNSN